MTMNAKSPADVGIPDAEKQRKLDAFAAAGAAFSQALDEERERIQSKWKAMTEEDRLDAFCAVIGLLHKGEIERGTSYRGLLYDVFGFGPESYILAQSMGLIDLHNSIYRRQDLEDLVSRAMVKLVGDHGGRVPTPEAIKDFVRKG